MLITVAATIVTIKVWYFTFTMHVKQHVKRSKPEDLDLVMAYDFDQVGSTISAISCGVL